jgi:hypothetical protein
VASPQPGASELCHGEEGEAELVAAGSDAAVVFEFVEEALDEVTLLVKRRGDADVVVRLSAAQLSMLLEGIGWRAVERS